MQPESSEIEQLTRDRGRALLQAVREREHHSALDRVYEHLIAWTTGNEGLKVELFRFVDVLPVLATPRAVTQHLVDYLDRPEVHLPPGTHRLLQTLSHTAPGQALLAGASRLGTRLMAQRFIAGAGADEATRVLQQLRRRDLTFSLDILGEAVTSEAEALAYQRKYLDLIRDLAQLAQDWPANPQTDMASFGPVPKVNVSVKLSSLYAHFRPMAADATARTVKARLRPLLRLARECDVFINFDMEQYETRGITRRIFEEILCEDEFLDWPDAGIVVQAYLRDAEDDLKRLLAWAASRGTPVWVRLVKGAYWDYETIVASQRGYPVPVFSHKHETDANYERLTALLLANWRTLRPAIATHNVRSAAHAQAVAEMLGLPPRTVEFQVLYGMGGPIGGALAAQGERVRVYVPCGELLPGMAYLVRRLLENTSNDSFIRHIEQSDLNDEQLLAPPQPAAMPEPVTAAAPAVAAVFHNEPVTDFSIPDRQRSMFEALDAVRSSLGQTVPIVIDGRPVESPTVWERLDPSDTARVAARVHFATVEQAGKAVAAAHRAFPAWRDTPVGRRAAVLRSVAAEFRRRRFEINAWQVYEVGKLWAEADADVAEAIDFCEYYAAEMERLAVPRERNVPGELNEYRYEPRGVAAVIAPWNFPLAILTGMSMAALVAGNTIVIKPSEQSSRVGYFLMEALTAAGVPDGSANFLAGEGEIVGPALIRDPRVALIAFTGSKAVGLSIIKEAAEVRPDQREITRVIAELGGKNAIIVDEDADLDEAVLGVLSSATGYSGQKCSACSRVIAIGAAYVPFCRRLAEAIKSIQFGPAEDPATTLGPVIDSGARQRIQDYITIGGREGRLLAHLEPPAELRDRGYYVPAAVFTGCPANGRLCQEEIFGPVLTVLHARDLGEALAIADNSLYALTGGFYSRSPGHIERVRREFRVGNLYINRGITGALVDRQPFGGARMSGVGSKAGGPDYLLQFLVPRTVTESVMRRGFAPSAELFQRR